MAVVALTLEGYDVITNVSVTGILTPQSHGIKSTERSISH